MRREERYKLNNEISTPNKWDLISFCIIFGLLAAFVWAATKIDLRFVMGQKNDISLDPSMLPLYAINTVSRMFIAMFFSLLTTFMIAPLAANNIHAERFIIPTIDILQSVPVLAMQAISVIPFISLFPNSILGPECAAIFAIFTSQVWNMILSLYQSLKTTPYDLIEAGHMYQLSKKQIFWKIEVPFATPGLLWNTIMSMSAGWFFVVTCEAISIANHDITLKGIGSYISTAIVEGNIKAMIYAIVTMFTVILIYDQLVFRPLLSWSEKFNSEIDDESSSHSSWFYDILTQTHLLKNIKSLYQSIIDLLPKRKTKTKLIFYSNQYSKYFQIIFWNICLVLSVITSLWFLYYIIKNNIELLELKEVLILGGITALKVMVLIIIASIIWIPIGVLIGLNPKLSSISLPLIQFFAAFPPNFFYPFIVIMILKYKLNVGIWTMPLMILGTQWYILFNIIAGTSAIPKEIKLAAKNLQVTGLLWWRKLILPAIIPYYITGAMAAAGGCWNASIVAEYLTWKDNTIIAVGLGSYIKQHTLNGNFANIALGTSIMCLYVVFFNRILWQPLYNYAEDHFRIT